MKRLGSMLVFFAVAAVAAVAGCGDPAYQLTGSVKSTTGQPIAGATVAAVCQKPPEPSAVADQDGKLHGRGIGFFSDGCKIEVSAPGFVKRTFDVKSSCRAKHLGSCVHVDLDAVLTPAS